MGFIEETGAAQHYRDARIAPIYEGTNGIQAMDLVGRKLSQDGGAVGQGADRRDEGDAEGRCGALYSGKPVERFAAAVERGRGRDPVAAGRQGGRGARRRRAGRRPTPI